MSRPGGRSVAAWARHDAEFRDPRQIVSQWEDASRVDPALLRCRVGGKWWELLERLRVTLLVTREYEHLVMAMRAGRRGPDVTFMRMPHPSGVVADRRTGRVWIASTRLPNQVFELKAVDGLMPRLDTGVGGVRGRPLVPAETRFYPGCLYLHDLALVGGKLHGAASGQNAVVRLGEGGSYRRVWWPRAIERGGRPVFGRNHIQLNSIAAGAGLRNSFFTASAGEMTSLRPGHRSFPVDGRGVVFSGATREPVARGLTRPHSVRLCGGRIWVDNSGYGEVGYAERGLFRSVLRLPGWTRGLCFCRGTAFVGTSRVIPRFQRYAPGLKAGAGVCGVHAMDLASGRVVGSCVWPAGNQVFAMDWLPSGMASGLPFAEGRTLRAGGIMRLFYAFEFSKTGRSVA